MSNLSIREPFRLVYTFGEPNLPNDPYGCVVVQIFADGRLLVDNVLAGAVTRSWEGTIARKTIERILARLEEGGFPEVPDHRIAPGATLRVVLVQSGYEEAHSLPIAWSAGREMVGYREAFRLLDSLIAELAGGAVPAVEVAEKGLVRVARTPSRPAVALGDAYDLGLAPALIGVSLLASDDGQRREAMAAAAGHREQLERLLGKHGAELPAAPDAAESYPDWADEVRWAVEELVSGPAAEAFALGRAAGKVRLALEEGNRERMDGALALLDLSRHAPAREIVALALGAPPDFRPRLEALTAALRRAIGA